MNHFYKQIQGWTTFESLYRKIVKDSPTNSHFVEVGSYKGQSAAFMAVEIINSQKNIRLDCVDMRETEKVESTQYYQKQENLVATFLQNTWPVLDVIRPIHLSSVEASKLYKDESLDFVFIDAAHDYDNVKLDLESWFPKIKQSGVIAGHDYGIYSGFTGVNTAVKSFLALKISQLLNGLSNIAFGLKNESFVY